MRAHLIENPSDHDEVLQFSSFNMNRIIRYNIRSQQSSLIDEKNTNYNVDVIGSFSVRCLTVLKGIKPDTIIVMGRTNMKRLHQSFYNVFNTKQMQWKNMTSAVNYQLLSNTIPIADDASVSANATTSMHSSGMRALICGQKWLIISGGHSDYNVLSIYELDHDTQYPVKLLDSIVTDSEVSGDEWEFQYHGIICLNCDTKVTMMQTDKIKKTEIKLLLFGQPWNCFEDTFVVIYIQIKEIINKPGSPTSIGKSISCTNRISYNEFRPFTNLKATSSWQIQSWSSFSYHFIKSTYLLMIGGLINETFTLFDSNNTVRRTVYCNLIDGDSTFGVWKCLPNEYDPPKKCLYFNTVSIDNGKKIAVLCIEDYPHLTPPITHWTLIIDDSIDWTIERIIWIAFYKNNIGKLSNYGIQTLPKDIVKYILSFLKNSNLLDMQNATTPNDAPCVLYESDETGSDGSSNLS